MSSNEKYQEYIIPYLQKFWTECRQDYDNSGLSVGLFLPHTFNGYDQCEKKIFYIGQDAPYWLAKERMEELFNEGKYSEYIQVNNNVLCPIDKRLAWGNSPSAFWTMVNKLHLYLMTNEWHDDITKISKDDKSILNTVGYGNVNSIPIKQTIINYSDWSRVNSSIYTYLREAILPIEQLKGVISNFNPDTIIILTNAISDKKAENLFKDMDVQWIAEVGSGELYVSLGGIQVGRKHVKIVWTSNPNRYKYIGTNLYEVSMMINNILQYKK